MNILLSPSSDVPIYKQLYEQICLMIIKGELKGGQALPSIRSVAQELSVSVITVKKAWEALEDSGLIVTMSTKGCFVASLGENALMRLKEEIIKEELTPVISRLKALGVSQKELLEAVASFFNK